MTCILPRPFLALGLATILACAASAEDEPSAEEQLRALIPQATSIHKVVFEKIATGTEAPTKESFDEFSLTAALMSLTTNPRDEVEGGGSFRYLSERGIPKAAEIASEMYHTIGAGRFRVTTKPVTMIQAHRITDFKVSTEGDNAVGSFAFHVLKLYDGQVRFTAAKEENSWQFKSFDMPGVNVHVALDEEGHWQDVAKQEADSTDAKATSR